jgi:hypothetical protein
MQDHTIRRWIWIAIIIQLVGYVVDVLWHGVLRPGVEPTTVGEMTHHLLTVHLPLYLGALSVLVVTGVALVRRALPGVAPVIAFCGAVVSAGAEAWHAYSHLQLDTQHAPIAGSLSALGFLVVIVAMTMSGRRRRRAGATGQERHAA